MLNSFIDTFKVSNLFGKMNIVLVFLIFLSITVLSVSGDKTFPIWLQVLALCDSAFVLYLYVNAYNTFGNTTWNSLVYSFPTFRKG